MPDVVQRGSIFDSDAWLPVLEECGVDLNDTTTFQSGSDDLVIIDDKWLIEPEGDGAWRVREWLGREDAHYVVAVEDEAVLDDAGDES
jgi:hypothetical protein